MDLAGALKQIDDAGAASATGRAGLLALTRTGAAGPEILSRLEVATADPLPRTAECIELLLAAAQGAWIADQRAPAAPRARDHARRLIALVPDLADGYRLLGFAHLSRGEIEDSFDVRHALAHVAGIIDRGLEDPSCVHPKKPK